MLKKNSEEKKDKSTRDDIAHYAAKLKIPEEKKKQNANQAYFVGEEKGLMEV